jgi:hypothetical protein
MKGYTEVFYYKFIDTKIRKEVAPFHKSICFLESGGFVLSSGTEGGDVPLGVFRAGV